MHRLGDGPWRGHPAISPGAATRRAAIRAKATANAESGNTVSTVAPAHLTCNRPTTVDDGRSQDRLSSPGRALPAGVA